MGANSDFFSNKPEVIELNNKLLSDLMYSFRFHIIASESNRQQYQGKINKKAYFNAPYTNLDSIDFGKWSANSTENFEYKLIDKNFQFYAGLWLSQIILSKEQEANIDYATKRGLGKCNMLFDKAMWGGNVGNPGIISPENCTERNSVKISSVGDLINVISNMRLWLSEKNQDDNNFAMLIPSELRPMLEEYQMASPASDIEARVYKYLGTEGKDFNWIPQDINADKKIVMSYTPNVNLLFVRTPEVLGTGTMNSGLVDESSIIQVGYGSVGVYSSNGAEAITSQPYTLG